VICGQELVKQKAKQNHIAFEQFFAGSLNIKDHVLSPDFINEL